MPVEMKIDQILAQLQKLREEHGEEVYQQARRDVAVSVVLKPNGEAFVGNAFPDLDIEELKKEAERRTAPADSQPSMAPEHVMLRLLQQQVPSIKTQAHFNLFSAAFDALRTTLDGYFTGDMDRALRGREALNKALDGASQVKGIVDRLEEIPAAERSDKAKEYLEPVKEFHEYDVQRQLLIELDGITDREALGQWYVKTKVLRDRIVGQQLRNELLDKIRAKRNDLEAQGVN